MDDRSALENTFRYIGHSVARVDALDKVTGKAHYPGDLYCPGMLYLKILFAGRPHARILNIDTRTAEAVPGVVCVLTGKDVPVNNYGLAFNDQPVLCDQVVRCEGDQVAVIVATTEEAAAWARDLVDVKYEDLPVISDARKAMEPGAPTLHANYPGNILDSIRIRRGDVCKGFEQADVIVEGSYFLPMQEHAYLQPEAGLAYMEGETVVIETAGQWAQHDQRQIAHSLNLPVESVRVIYKAIGGAFGGREDISVQLVLALAAWKTGQPVKIIWSREESIRGHGKRHQMFITSRWGARKDGRVVAAEVNVVSDAGAYAYTSTMVLGHAALTCTGVYSIPNVSVDAYAIYTNNVPGAAFRGFGSPQGLFAAEMQMDKLAAALQIDPVSMRARNLLHAGDLISTGAPLPESIHFDHLLETCARRAGWSHAGAGWMAPPQPEGLPTKRKRGVGIALGVKNIGFSFGYPEESSATIVLKGGAEIEEAKVYFSGAECGQGVETVIQQMAAEALGLPMAKIRWVGADTSLSPEAGSASASRLTLMGGNAVKGAAREALERWTNEERPATATYTYHAPLTTGFDAESGYSRPHVVFSPVAQAVEVEVDTETGELNVLRVVTALDVGQAINPGLLEGQVEGAVAQAIGYAILENFISQEGRIQTPNLTTYLLPTVLDVPTVVETLRVDHLDPVGPWGARGVGETPFIAFAPALASALYDATKVWFDRIPLTPPVVLAGLRGKQNEITK
jgi:CO/xanthine dehydrogenase Mo-binding subunit